MAPTIPASEFATNTHLSIAEPVSYLKFIDGLRGVAILMVIAVHTSQHVTNLADSTFRVKTFEMLVTSGARGVQLFFVLSALTLFNSSAHRFAQDTYPKLSFWLRRAFRILPFWWLMHVYYVLRNPIPLQFVVPSLFLYFGFIRYRTGSDVIPGGWSIFVEETFYLLMPFLFTRIKNVTSALYLCLSLYAVSYVWDWSHSFFPEANAFHFDFPLTQWLCFGLGILAFFAMNTETFKKMASNVTLGRMMDCILLLAILELLGLPNYHQAIRTQTLVFLLMVMTAGFRHSFTRRATENRLLVLYGTCCYSLYLLHFLILDFLDPYRERFLAVLRLSHAPMDIQFLAWYPVVCLAGLGAGLVSFRLIEKPCVNLGKRLITRLNRKPLPLSELTTQRAS